ncbi:P-loop containing nucleoside triphosphate hydrolase protein [Schizophyllum commune H4-8]|nr:P-loop containing nucleoside triphosphate hydrolase protein [Schizophyllum commune H4-8]KAI5900596.1 P-loop containing nucleoside triphosphate hydrolase protein [Schizophyllum commune H4-8]
MSPVPLNAPRIELLEQTLCQTFNISSVYSFQRQTGQNSLQGRSTVLNVPTGGGKTIAFFYALFYHWFVGNTRPDDQKIVLVVSPLIALMESQADDLTARGVPAIALSAKRMKDGNIFKKCAAGDYRVVLASPELALSPDFQRTVLMSPTFRNNIMQLVIDEAHAISEWGTDDFRPDYRRLGTLRGLLPKGTPIVCTSATLPTEVLDDICATLNLPPDCDRILFSNSKPNITLSVHQLQHPDSSFADLVTLIPDNATCAEDIPMTLIYASSRLEVEDMQDFLRRHLPVGIPKTAVEFYHRHIEDGRKDIVLQKLRAGEIRICACTDVLSWGIDLRNIQRVGIWKKPLTFNSLVQKYGRCVRNPLEIGICILYISKAVYKLCEKGLAPLPEAVAARVDTEAGLGVQDTDVTEGVRVETSTDYDVALPSASSRKGPRKKNCATRDGQFLTKYIGTKGCRRAVWDEFFENATKHQLITSPPPSIRCCDNCDPIPTDIVALDDPRQLQRGRRQRAPEEVEEAVREDWYRADYPSNHFLSGSYLLSDTLVSTISGAATSFDSLADFDKRFRWHWSARYGTRLVDAVLSERRRFQVVPEPTTGVASTSTLSAEIVAGSTDPSAIPSIEPPPKRHRGTAKSIAAYKAYQDVFASCRRDIETHEEPAGHVIAKRFRALPRRTGTTAAYYTTCTTPVAISTIKQKETKREYATLTDYAADWHLLARNTRRFYGPGSDAYHDSLILDRIVDEAIWKHGRSSNLSGAEGLTDPAANTNYSSMDTISVPEVKLLVIVYNILERWTCRLNISIVLPLFNLCDTIVDYIITLTLNRNVFVVLLNRLLLHRTKVCCSDFQQVAHGFDLAVSWTIGNVRLELLLLKQGGKEHDLLRHVRSCMPIPVVGNIECALYHSHRVTEDEAPVAGATRHPLEATATARQV